MHGRKLATLVLLAFACDGEFRFDRGTPASSGGSSGGQAGPQGGAAAGTSSAGSLSSAGAVSSAGSVSSAGAASSAGGASSAGSANVGGMSGASGAAGDTECEVCEMHGLFCSDEADVSCVECRNDLDCPMANPYCDAGIHRCIPCTPSDGCPAGSVCDGWSHSCLQSCATELDPDHDCSRSTHMCNTRRSVCVECLGDADCNSNPQGPHCAAGARCAECAVDSDCGTLGRVCDPLTFTCVVCKDSRDCGAPLVCDPASHTCVGGEYDREK